MCLRHERSDCRHCQRSKTRSDSFLAAESLVFIAALLNSQPIVDSMVSFVCFSILLLYLGVGKKHYGLFLGAVQILLLQCMTLLNVKFFGMLSTSG